MFIKFHLLVFIIVTVISFSYFSYILAFNYVTIIQPFAFLKQTAIHGACLLFYEFYIYVWLNIFIWHIFIIFFPFLQFFQDSPHLHRQLTSWPFSSEKEKETKKQNTKIQTNK